ncbi:MAG: hypothetical protein IJF27_02330, partial [Oscillospiraceae bacterium]|nr:hypothetical protein [Oscillospiraceae bacterium]
MFKNRFGSHYITVRSGGESSKSMTSFAKTVKTLIVFCMVVVISLTFFSAYEHIKEVQEEKNRQDFLNEQNREKIKYIVPSSNDTVSDEVKAQYDAAIATERAARSQYRLALDGAQEEDKDMAAAKVLQAQGAVA